MRNRFSRCGKRRPTYLASHICNVANSLLQLCMCLLLGRLTCTPESMCAKHRARSRIAEQRRLLSGSDGPRGRADWRRASNRAIVRRRRPASGPLHAIAAVAAAWRYAVEVGSAWADDTRRMRVIITHRSSWQPRATVSAHRRGTERQVAAEQRTAAAPASDIIVVIKRASLSPPRARRQRRSKIFSPLSSPNEKAQRLSPGRPTTSEQVFVACRYVDADVLSITGSRTVISLCLWQLTAHSSRRRPITKNPRRN